ncbi:hypothetical protein B0H14DRAFT_2598202 [Mycena olivaceomarginata]|nr:hypothetical protein B0H14DRAFT_2598202 [Mycena olivaceomarginata]
MGWERWWCMLVLAWEMAVVALGAAESTGGPSLGLGQGFRRHRASEILAGETTSLSMAFCGKPGSRHLRGGGKGDHRRRYEVSVQLPACCLGWKKTGSKVVKTWQKKVLGKAGELGT